MRFYIFNNCIPTRIGMSGSDRRALEYAKHFLSAGHKVTVIIPKIALARYERTGAEFIITDEIQEEVRPTFGFLVKRIKKANASLNGLALKESEIIYSSSDIIADSLPAIGLKKRNPKTPLICGMHLLAPSPFKGFKGAFTKRVRLPSLSGLYYYFSQKFVLANLKQYADLMLVSNSHDREKLIKRGFLENRVLVAYGATDQGLIEQVSEGAKQYDAVFVGRAHEQKGIGDLFMLVKKVAKIRPGFKLALVSDIKDTVLKKTTEEYDIKDNIVFFGFKDGIEKFRIMKASRILIFPSYYESFGMVIVEAMACGLPVVAYDLPVYAGIFTQGIVKIKISDCNAMAEELLYLLSDTKRLNELSAQALELGRSFTWGNSARAILKGLQK